MSLEVEMMEGTDVRWNHTFFNPLVLLPVVLSAVWILWDLFYASYLLAFVVKSILNLCLKDTGIKIGQLRFNIVTGRVIFKDVEIYRRDDSIRIADGYGVFRWWKRPAVTDDEIQCKRCSAQSAASANKKTSLLYLELSGFEYHWYHRSDIYDWWGRPKVEDTDPDGTGGSWITAIQPTVHCTFKKGKLMFGNQLVENTLVVHFDYAEGHYSVTQASNPYDKLMHLVKFHGDNIRAVLQPTPGYLSNSTEHTVNLNGEDKCVLLKTDFLECVYSLDIPGLVPLDDTSSPKYAFDVYLGTNTVANYGTFINRQRIILQKLFFPNDYTVRHIDKTPQPGEKRVYTSFDISVFASTPATLNIPFQGNSGECHLSFTISGASQVTINQPWVTKEDGYTTTVTGKLSELEVFTSLPYEPLGKARTVNIFTTLQFPRVWNSTQTWDMKFSVDQSQVNILFSYIDFFNELLDDWVGADIQDILDFVPVDWHIGVDMLNYEIFLFTNRYNWIDTSPDGIENERLAFCGKSGHISFELPLIEFLPNEQKVVFSAQGQNLVVRHYFPPSSASRESVFALSSSNKDRWRVMDPPDDKEPDVLHPLTRSISQPIEPYQDKSAGQRMGTEEFKRTHHRRGSEPLFSHSQTRHRLPKSAMERISEETKEDMPGRSLFMTSGKEFFPMGYRCSTSYEAGWLDLGCGPAINIHITYEGHNSDMMHVKTNSRMVPSRVTVIVDVPCVLVRVFGSLARDLLALKENYPGEYMYFKTFSSQSSETPDLNTKKEKIDHLNAGNSFDITDGSHEPDERFLDISVDFKMHNITGEFPTHLPHGCPKDFPLPSAHSELFSVHVEYKGDETTVQLLVDPVSVHLPSMGSGSKEYNLGILALSGVTFTCHGFTEFMLKERVEYAWMMKLDLGRIVGSVMVEQLFPVVDFFQTALSHIMSPGSDVYEAPDAILIEPNAEPLSEILKYKLFSLTVSSVDVNVREAKSLLNVQTPGFDLDLCNLHKGVETLSVSFCLKHLSLSTFIVPPTNTNSSVLLECACVDVGIIQGDICLREANEAAPERQQTFLKRADELSRRLWFLWDNSFHCGCCGGCQYLEGSIRRNETLESSHPSRYFSACSKFPVADDAISSTIPFPSFLTFDNLVSLEHLHHVLLTNYGFGDLTHLVVPSQPVSESEGVEIASQDSEGSFDTARTSLHSDSPSDEETYASFENSPQVSERNSHVRKASQVGIVTTEQGEILQSLPTSSRKSPSKVNNMISAYSSVLDKYKCHVKSFRINARSQNCITTQLRSGHLFQTDFSSGHSSPWHAVPKGSQKKRSPLFLVEIPEISHFSVGHLPSVGPRETPTKYHERMSRCFQDGGLLDETLAYVSVSINVTGNIGILLSPPAVTVINKYISHVNKFFKSRTAHSLLDAISLESLQTVNSHIKSTNNNSHFQVPSNQLTPLVHLSVKMSPSAHCNLQMLHASPVPSLSSETDAELMRSSVVNVFISGVECNALFYHYSLTVGQGSHSSENQQIPDSIQTTLRIAMDMQLPVLQAGLHILTELESKQLLGIAPSQSFLDFQVDLPQSDSKHQVINIAELSLSKSSVVVAAKIIQSEMSSDPILTWSQIDTCLHRKVNLETPYIGNDTELSHNTVAINVKVPSVTLQVGGPSHGIPTANDVCIDPAIVATFVKVWKPLIEEIIESGNSAWRSKIIQDRRLLLSLLASAAEMATQSPVFVPILSDVSTKVRQSVVFSLISQLWRGLPAVREQSSVEISSDCKDGFLSQSIMAMALSMTLRHYTEETISTTPVQLKGIRSHHGNFNVGVTTSAPSIASYHSISPSPSELGVPNVAFTPHQRNSMKTVQGEDYLTLIDGTSYTHFVVLRESLLAFFKSSGIVVAPQLKVECCNSSKLSMEYGLQFHEATVIVTDGTVKTIDSHETPPEFLMEQLHISGSLKYMQESRNASSRVTNYVITISHKQSDANFPQKLKSNITSKCSVSVKTIAVHVTLPLLMLFRHTSESLNLIRDSLQNLKISLPQTLFQAFDQSLVSDVDNMDVNGVAQSSNLTGVQKILQKLLEFEQRHLLHMTKSAAASISPQSVHISTPGSKMKLVDNCGSNVHDLHVHSKSGPLNDNISACNLSMSSGTSDHADLSATANVAVDDYLMLSSNSHHFEGLEDTDSPRFFSSDPEAPIQSSMATYDTSKSTIKVSLNTVDKEEPECPDSHNMRDIIAIPDEQLEFSVFGSIKITRVCFSTRIESLLLLAEVYGISGSVDCRKIPPDMYTQFSTTPTSAGSHIPLVYKLLPTYLSISSTLKRTVVRAADRAISASDLAILCVESLEFCTSCCYLNKQPAPAYRCLVRFPEVSLDVKQPPIVLHKKLHKYIPTFTTIYNEVFASPALRSKNEGLFAVSTPAPVNVSELHFPPHLPKGSALFFLNQFKMIVRPLSSLTVSYDIAPVTAQMETTSVVKFILSIGQHQLEFNAKEYKDELSLRPIPLPVVLLKGNVVPRPYSRLPSITLETSVKQVVIDVTTDVLNQLLILQSAFIKEINELLNMFFNIGESIPQQRLTAINLKQPADTGFELISLLNSVKLSMQGIKMTVSTPLSTAVRFSTGNKIEMLITNPSHHSDTPSLTLKNYLTLHGKVETEINVALGFIQEETDIEEEDDFIELAYFKTWIAVRNTLQQNTPLGDSVDQPVSLDTFLISIHSPHLYIQSTAVEKAILFWVNCKSVYNFWQNEHKQLNAEVQAATEAFVGRFTKPVQMKTPSIDFSKPRLVQITVNDVGACMPLVHLPSTPHSSQKGFPALVLTIKEMQVSLNLSKKLASAGKFTGFLIRFDEQFHFRHKTWTNDPKKHKFLNYGIVPSGTYRFCVVNKHKLSGSDDTEKLFSAFTWHMSGININANTDIGHHISTLVRTLTTIGSDLEEPDTQSSSPVSKAIHSSFLPRLGHKRAHSYSSRSFVDDQATLKAMELDLAKQTRKLQKLKQTGAAPDSLKFEEDTFHKLEMDLVRGLRKVFRKGRGMTLQQIGQIFSPRSSVSQEMMQGRKRLVPSSTLPRRRLTTNFEESDMDTTQPNFRTHFRHRSDFTPDILRMIQMEEGELNASVTTTHVGTESPLITSAGSLGIVEEVNDDIEDTCISNNEDNMEPLKRSEPLIPSINIEINVTINVDSGSIVLHKEDLTYQEHHSSVSGFKTTIDSPHLSHRKEKTKTSIDTKLLIPAVEVKAHYQSIVGQSHVTVQQSPIPSEHCAFQENSGTGVVSPMISTTCDKSGNPIKRGLLTITAIIAPLPHDLELNPSLLEFVEEVVRPINNSQENESDDDDDDDDDDDYNTKSEREVQLAKSQVSTRPLSFPVDVSIIFTIHPSKIYLTCHPHAHVKCLIEIPTVNFTISFSLFTQRQFEAFPQQSSLDNSSLEDNEITTFNNLHITGCFKTFALIMFTPSVQTGSGKHGDSSKREKEAFNLVLGQAFVHLSRKTVYVRLPSSGKLVDDYAIQEKLKLSVIPVIESLILTYDWRRLNDITWFRKCWYPTGLVEALFTGRKSKNEVANSPSPVDQQFASYVSPTHSDISNEPSGGADMSDTITAEIAIAVAVVDLRLYANMAQFMGNAHVLLSHLQGLSHADIQSSELVLFVCDGVIEEMEIDAQGGVVAGDLTINNTKLHVMMSSQDGIVPEHKASLSVDIVQGHIDYMSAHIMLLRVVQLHINVWDIWKGVSHSSEDQNTLPSIQVFASFHWLTFQLVIHRSTVKAVFGIAQRMYDFVMQQKKRSERTIGLMLPAGTAASTAFAAYQEEQKRAERSRAAEMDNPVLESHHWVWAVKVGSIELMKAVGIDISSDVSLGGSIDVSGTNMCLVCFHGTSFRETEWAAFNIDFLWAQFSTVAIPGLGEVTEGTEDKPITRICSQTCKLRLGEEGGKLSELAAVYRVSAGRGGVPPISRKEIPDWLNYACIDHYIHEGQNLSGRPYLFLKQSQKLTIQHIIGVPAFEVTLINDHFWPSLEVLLNHRQSALMECATVECSVMSTFYEGISVTTTVENYLFLHDLFQAYIEQVDKQKTSFRPPFTGIQSLEPEKSEITIRRFVSIHWELDPHLFLMGKATWASGQFNPHINWLLERLGFDHARTTIPKCIQMGLMDPLDLGIASVLEVLITVSGTKKMRTNCQ